ncbi:MAG: hypothetical protein DME09_08535 [Candidatus Rokuibacteriota bacterium]|nr:MAG: hypothetical protein DME09_08535 [Candidatus Rokubacteria bacterium]
MIKLSDVKVRPQYRTRVRYRLNTRAHGPTAAGRHYGISARTIRRWRRRWRRDGLEGLVPAYARHRLRHVTPVAIELIREARARSSATGPRGPGSGSSAPTGSGSPWARFNGSSGTSGCRACAAPASACPGR